MLCYVMLCYVMLCYVMLCYVMLCYVMLCYVMLCYVMLCYVMLCYVMLCYVMLCYVMLCYVVIWYVRRISQLRKRPHAPSNGCQGKSRKEVSEKPVRASKWGRDPTKVHAQYLRFPCAETRKLARAGTSASKQAFNLSHGRVSTKGFPTKSY